MSDSRSASQDSFPYDVFLSHNRAQKDWTRDLACKLRDEGFAVWFDEWCLLPAENWIVGLTRGLKESRKIALVLSPAFLDAEWPRFEEYIAVIRDPSARDAQILPLIHTSCEMPPELSFRQALEFSDTHNDSRHYEFHLAQLMAFLDPSRERPTDFGQFCQTREDLTPDALPPVGPLPAGSVMPFLHNPDFVGREDELKSLYEKLNAGVSVSLGQTAAATGLGGIGKTQLAVEFVYRYGRRFDGGVFWLDMSEPANIPNEISLCGGIKGMNLPGFDSLSLGDQVAAVMKEWQGSRRRLVVFDNVEQLEIVDEWRQATEGTRTLITTRIDSEDHRWRGRGIETISVNTLPRDRSLELLCQGMDDTPDDPDERQAADDICELLGDLPLAIHLAGAYLSIYKHAVSMREYLEELRSQPVLTNPALVDEIRDPSPTRHLQNVAATFETSYNRLDQENDADALAARLFHLTSHFAPVSILQELLTQALKMDKDKAADRRKVADAVNRLCELGLVKVEEGGRVWIHRLLREFAHLHPADGQEVSEAAEDVWEAIGDFASEVNKLGLPAPLRQAVEHLRHAAQAAQVRESEQAGRLYNSLGYHLKEIADFDSAKENYQRAIEIGEAVYGKDHPNMAAAINNLGDVLQDLGDFDGAKENFQRAIEIDEAVYGKDHPDVARAINNLGSALQDLGDLDGAKENFQRAIEIGEAVYGKDHPSVATCVNNLGSVLKTLGDLDGAKENFQRALEIDEAVYGKDHPNVARDVNNLGDVLQDLGDLDGAKKNYQRALEIDEAVYGKDHPNVARDVNNLGLVLHAIGDLDGAKENFQRALDIFERRLGADHPSTRTVRENLGLLLNSGA